MKIKELAFNNFRLFKRFVCTFEPDVTVLVGLNAQGKTSVLDGIAIALGQFICGFGTGKDIGFSKQDIRLEKYLSGGEVQDGGSASVAGHYHMEHQLPVSITATPYPEFAPYESWTRTRNTLKGRTSQVKSLKQLAGDLQKQVQAGAEVTLPLIAYYGTGRLWTQKRIAESKQLQSRVDSRLAGYQDCLESASRYATFSAWLRKETIADYEYKMASLERGEAPKPTARTLLLGAVTTAINTVLQPTLWGNVRYSAIHQEVVAAHPEHGDIPVSQLSDGVRTTIGVVADIAYRAVRLNPHLLENAAKETPGIVLIDEVDLHLHPQWQQLILQYLHEAFPNLQIIVTTHSPQVLSTAQRRQIRLLTREKGLDDGFDIASLPMGETYAEASNDLLERVMHVSARPPLPQVSKFEAYMRLIALGQHQTDEAKQLRKELEALIGSEHGDLQRADRAIQRKELLG